MVKIIYYRDSHRVTITGHANGGEVGKDLICAGVSTLAQTLAAFVIALKDARHTKNPTIKLNEGDSFIACEVKAKHKSHVMLVFDAICGGFELLAQRYPEHVLYEMKD